MEEAAGGTEWVVTTRILQPGAVIVRYRGHAYPTPMTAIFEREDGLRVEIEIHITEERGPVPMSATISAPDGIASEARQPIASMTRFAVSDAFERRVEPARGPTVRTDKDRLERIAELYHQAIEEGRTVTELIELKEGVATKTAYDLIAKARKAGHLPPSPPGRKAKTKETS